MREQKRPDYYTLLGLSSEATPEEIKRRYRTLVRRYHPDVRPDKEAAHQQFVRLAEAYQTLSDPDRRRAYDAALQHLSGASPEVSKPPPSAPARSRTADFQRIARERQIKALLSMAERYLARRQYHSALEQCKKIVRLDPNNAAAHALWGDICLEQRDFEQAILRYTYAVQFAPSSALYNEKLQQALWQEQRAQSRSRGRGTPFQSAPFASGNRAAPGAHFSSPTASTPPRRVARGMGQPFFNAVLVLSCLGLAYWTLRSPSDRVISEQVPIPFPLALGAVAEGALMGMLFALNRWLGRFDEELVYITVPERGGSGAPVGIYLCLASAIWIYLGLVVYFVLALLNEYLSRSVLKAFGLTFFIVGLAALYVFLNSSEAWKLILLLGGNLVFPAVILGWLLGSVGQKPW